MWRNTKWREPKKPGFYLVTYNGETKIAQWDGRNGSGWPACDLFKVFVLDGYPHVDTFGVSHWKPLPKPWKKKFGRIKGK